MRLLNRLNQYQRLWQPSAGKPQTVTISELAERCFCSERHVRTLLRQAQEAGWLEWQAQSGRGKRGQLRFLVTPESLRNAMMEQALETGKQQDVLELAQNGLQDRLIARVALAIRPADRHAAALFLWLRSLAQDRPINV